MKRLGVAVLLLGILFCPYVATAEESAKEYCVELAEKNSEASAIDLFDPSAPDEKRMKSLEIYMKLSADVRCPEYGYSLGLLYRHGAGLRGNLLAKDTAKARTLILPYAEDGFLAAYSDLAEMALQEGNPREAMQWTQTYLYLLKTYSAYFGQQPKFDRSGYNGDLLRRTELAWRERKSEFEDKWIVEDFSRYLSGREARIAAKIKEKEDDLKRVEPGRDGIDGLRVSKMGQCKARIKKVLGGYAMYLVEILPSGKISRVVSENFVPSPVVAEKLMPCVFVYEFQRFDGPDPKVGRIPIMYGYAHGPMF